MNTPAISNPVNIASDSASMAKSSESPVDTPFGQVLSREVAARETSSEPVAKAGSGKESEEARVARSDTGTDNTAVGQKPAAAASANGTGAGEAATTGGDADSSEAEIDTAVSAASADMLALIAGLAQTAPVRTAAGTEADAGNAAEPAMSAAGLLAPGAAATTVVATTAAATTEIAASDTALASGAADAVVGGSGRGPDTAALANSLALGARAEAGKAAGDRKAAPDMKESDAGLMPARDGRTSTEAGPSATSAGRADFAAQQSLREAAGAKALPDGQQGAAAPISIPGLSQTQAQHLQQAQAMPGHMADRLAPRVGTPAWDQALGQKVVWMVGGELQSASLTLNPPDLGPLQVVLNVANSQATANFTAAQPEVRQALEAAMPKLREMLGEAGIELSQASVSAGMPNNPQNAFERPQQGQGAQHAASRGDDADQAAPAVRSQPITGGQGLVDTFA